MLRTFLIALSLLPLAAAQAQAPIERRPPATTATPALNPVDPAWAIFMETSANAIAQPVTVQTDAQILHCILTGVMPEALNCQRPTPIFLRPRWDAPIPRTHILRVIKPDHAASGFIGGLVGFGIGTGIAATHSQAGDPANAILSGVLVGTISGYVWYHAPFIHHTLYRAP